SSLFAATHLIAGVEIAWRESTALELRQVSVLRAPNNLFALYLCLENAPQSLLRSDLPHASPDSARSWAPGRSSPHRAHAAGASAPRLIAPGFQARNWQVKGWPRHSFALPVATIPSATAPSWFCRCLIL